MKRSLWKNLSATFFGRKGRAEKEGSARSDVCRIGQASDALRTEQPHSCTDDPQKDWRYVGDDEEGTPILLDGARIVRQSGSSFVQVWLKHVPSRNTRSLQQAERYLKETRHDWKSFHHIEQLIELDFNQDLITDLALGFFDQAGHLLHQVQFHEKARRPFGTEAVYSVIKEAIARLEAKTEHHAEPPNSEAPSIDDKIELKLQEINSALEAFDTCGESENITPKTSH